jgi:hypothetical protein
MKTLSINEIHQLMAEKYGDDELDKNHSMTAVGIVLLSAAVLGTPDTVALQTFTGYGGNFIAAISANMENNKLWESGRYYCDSWFSGSEITDDDEFWANISAACGELWFPGADTSIGMDAQALLDTVTS